MFYLIVHYSESMSNTIIQINIQIINNNLIIIQIKLLNNLIIIQIKLLNNLIIIQIKLLNNCIEYETAVMDYTIKKH